MNNPQLSKRLEFLRENPAILFGAMLGAGLVGALLLRRTRAPELLAEGEQQLTTALKAGDLEGVIREATRQGFEAGRAVERAAQVEKSRGPLGLTPQEWLAFIGIVVPLAKQVMDSVRSRQGTDGPVAGGRFDSK